MHTHTALMLSFAALTAACAAGTTRTAGGELAPVSPVNGNWLPAGTSMNARLNQSIETVASRSGDSFSATVINPVYAQDGTVAIPAGTILHGRITGVHNATAPGEQSLIRLAFEDLQMHGRTYPVTASISNVVLERPTTAAARGAAAGTAPGTVISGAELSKMLKSGLLGAATGTVISMGVGGTENVMPAGSTMTVRTNEDVRIR
jgi:hypothetical protein